MMRRAAVVLVTIVYAYPLGWMLWRTTEPPTGGTRTAAIAENFDAALRYGAPLTAEQKDEPFWRRWWHSPFRRHFVNTLILAVLGTAGTVLSNAMIAYGFSRIRWPGRDLIFYLSLATLMLPFAVTMIPLYQVYRELGWIGTLKPLWAPAWLGNAFGIFLLRQFMLRIPRDLSDAARIDGCNEWMTFTQVILPQTRPALIVVGLFHFMYVWNDFLGPLIYLTDQEDFTLSLGLQAYASRHGGVNEPQLLAATTLVILPVLMVFVVCQRFFRQAASVSGMKG